MTKFKIYYYQNKLLIKIQFTLYNRINKFKIKNKKVSKNLYKTIN